MQVGFIEAGVTAKLWEMADVVEVLEAWEARHMAGLHRAKKPLATNRSPAGNNPLGLNHKATGAATARPYDDPHSLEPPADRTQRQLFMRGLSRVGQGGSFLLKGRHAMTHYVITYDIRTRPDHDYQPLYDQLNSWRAAHLQNSAWLADLNGTAIQVRDVLKAHMHSDDTFCVLEIFRNSKWATWNARETGTDWLKAHMDQQ